MLPVKDIPAGKLFGDDRALRAGVRAGAAVDADIRVNFVDVALGNCSDRAFVDASTASYAVLCDFVSHKFMSLNNRCFIPSAPSRDNMTRPAKTLQI